MTMMIRDNNYHDYDDNEEDDYHDLDVSKATVIGGKVRLEICKFFSFRLHSNLAFRVVEKCPENKYLLFKKRRLKVCLLKL